MSSRSNPAKIYSSVIEVLELRSEFASYLSIGAARPQFMLRFGYADPVPRSLRRPVEQVLKSPNTTP